MSTNFFKEFEEKKRRMRILILGAYSPSIYEDRLSRLKECLLQRNYRNAKLVKDFPDKPSFHEKRYAHIVAKSQFYIKFWADALLFVYFRGAMNEGVSIELEFCCTKVLEKLGFSVVFGEKDLSLSSMILGSIQIHEIKADAFENDLELCEKSIGYLTNFTYRLYWYL